MESEIRMDVATPSGGSQLFCETVALTFDECFWAKINSPFYNLLISKHAFCTCDKNEFNGYG